MCIMGLHGFAVHSDRTQDSTFSVRAFREVKGFQGCITVIARSWALPILSPARMHHLSQAKDHLPGAQAWPLRMISNIYKPLNSKISVHVRAFWSLKRTRLSSECKMIMLRSMHKSAHVEVLLFHPRSVPAVCCKLAYGFAGSWEEVCFAPGVVQMQDGCQASAGVRSKLPSSENKGSLEGSSTAENAMPTRMPCFLRTRILLRILW